ncbi:MAG TPA: hypothetical protein VGQ50_09565 [Actinomycetota bacterium]|nr:hypothetical protein [Actinomycetota bacterium]
MLAIRIARIPIAGCIVVILAATQASAGSIRAGRLGIGDSVMLGAKQELRARGFGVVDAVVSRQFYRAPALVRYWRRQGRLPEDVVIHLGTNGTVNLTDCYHAVRAAGRRKVFLVNLKVPRSWRAEDNQRLHHCAKHFPNAYLIDWYGHSHDRPGWFASDGYHLSGTGRIAYATLIKREVARHDG